MGVIAKEKLSDLHKDFADRYLVTMSAAEAYRQMSVVRGISVKKPDQAGWKLLQRQDVQEYLAEHMAARASRLGIERDDVLGELRDQLRVTLPDVVEWDETGARAKPSAELTQLERKAIKKMRCTTTVRQFFGKNGKVVAETTTTHTEVELHDRMAVVNKVGQHLGMWEADDGKPKAVTNNMLVILPGKLTEDAWKAKVAEAVKVHEAAQMLEPPGGKR